MIPHSEKQLMQPSPSTNADEGATTTTTRRRRDSREKRKAQRRGDHRNVMPAADESRSRNSGNRVQSVEP